MIECDDAARLIARRADGSDEQVEERMALDAHLSECAVCRRALEEHQGVVAVLRSRPLSPLSPAFSARLAAGLDDASGWFGIVDWRIWTFRLAPVALALALVALLTSGSTRAQSSSRITIEEWARSGLDSSSAASLLWQQEASPESLLESMVTGRRPSAGESGSVR